MISIRVRTVTVRSRRLALAATLGVSALGLGGCVGIMTLAASSTLGIAAVYQRWEDRGVQRGQNEELRALREELARTRAVLERR